ncbi:endoplasmic reticulum membrane sensor NFE2L1b isoform X2 [Sinocyclocheilus anshuiensis]|uniref:Endoplasmic reticulum membrane sensor NFE2L1 n=1 Tax=Sinocyclocheilus anshuiensis TaxID=1608454 RepID=A0A671NDR4_9TELE|nr:PREDICTED: nuclear factor erythroid 2-related factor 1 isoform X2 [Sinocyclocheilus anshuiensis]
MLYLKKYFTEGLIQFTILLSLIGVRLDLDTYLNNQLPPLREIILGPSSAYTQTQFHNLRNTLDGYGIHPKSVDLDHFFTTRRLLNQVRSLDHLRVPSTELSAWLVHRDPETVVSATSQSGPSIALDNGGSLEDVNNSEASAMRGTGGASETTYSLSGEDSLGAVAPEDSQEQGERESSDDLSKELTSLGAQTSLSLQECLRLLEATFPFGEEPEFQATEPTSQLRASTEETPSTSQGIPLQAPVSQSDTPLDLEQQWQDIMSIMELQDMEVNNTAVNVTMNNDPNNNNASTTESATIGSFELPRSTLINQDVSLHQASLPSCSQDFPTLFNPELDSTRVQRPTLVRLSSSNSSNINSTFGATNLTGLFLPPPLNSTTNLTTTPVLPDPFSSLLEESMLDEISLLDLAMEEGFSQDQASQLEDELDSDSGLSLDSSHSPASPSNSETSCSSAASSSSTSATFSEEGAVGYSTDSEAATAEAEEGAVGGYQPEYSKLCRMSYQDPSQFHGIPQLENVNHNHTYNLPLASSYSERSQLSASCSKKGRDKQMQQTKLQPPQDCVDRQSSRDERRARAMDIPFSNDKIINLPVEEFNELLAKHHLNEDQLSLIRDIRRRGKNKMAAQNCRKRKLDTILKLEQGVQDLQREKAQLLKEKMEYCKCIRQTKQKVQSLSQELFAQLRDEEGRRYSASEYFLQYGPDGVLLMPRNMTTEQSNKSDKKQKDKKK